MNSSVTTSTLTAAFLWSAWVLCAGGSCRTGGVRAEPAYGLLRASEEAKETQTCSTGCSGGRRWLPA
jgi:hypothetical protein